MAIYIIVALITAICSEISVKSKYKIVRWFNILLVISIPSILYAIRYGIGTDYFTYVSAFEKLQIKGFDSRFEWGYVLINLIVGRLGGSVETVFFITSIIMISFVYFAVRYYSESTNVGVAMFVYMMMYYQMSYNVVRQSVAIAVCLYSIKYIHERKLIKFTISVLIATSFHLSALLIFPVYFLHRVLGQKGKKMSRIFLYIIVLMAILNMKKLLMPIINKVPSLSYYSLYLKSNRSDFSIGLFSRFIPFLLIGLFLYKYISKRDKKFILIFSLFTIGLILKLTSLVGANYISRIALSFEVVLVLLVAYSVKAFNERREFFASFILLVYVFINWWYIYIYTGSHGTFPYTTIFQL